MSSEVRSGRERCMIYSGGVGASGNHADVEPLTLVPVSLDLGRRIVTTQTTPTGKLTITFEKVGEEPNGDDILQVVDVVYRSTVDSPHETVQVDSLDEEDDGLGDPDDDALDTTVSYEQSLSEYQSTLDTCVREYGLEPELARDFIARWGQMIPGELMQGVLIGTVHSGQSMKGLELVDERGVYIGLTRALDADESTVDNSEQAPYGKA